MRLSSKEHAYPEELMGSNGPAPDQLSIGPLKGQDAGAIVRAARLAAGLSLVGLGRRCGYSASQLSRYERGITPLTDITLLHRFSQALAIPPQVFGLWEDGEDLVRRRELLAGTAGLVGAAAFGFPLGARSKTPRQHAARPRLHHRG
jgi:transcriptional regulator with XRE-family HTH domain